MAEKIDECKIAKTDLGKSLQAKLDSGNQLTQVELTDFQKENAKLIASWKREIIEKTKQDKSGVLKCALEVWINFNNSLVDDKRYWQNLLEFIKGQLNIENIDVKIYDLLNKPESLNKDFQFSLFKNKIILAPIDNEELLNKIDLWPLNLWDTEIVSPKSDL